MPKQVTFCSGLLLWSLVSWRYCCTWRLYLYSTRRK